MGWNDKQKLQQWMNWTENLTPISTVKNCDKGSMLHYWEGREA